MPIKCIQRPNRTKKRVWTARAVARVACYAVKSGDVEPDEILRGVADCVSRDLCDRVKQATDPIKENILKLTARITPISQFVRTVATSVREVADLLSSIPIIRRRLNDIATDIESLDDSISEALIDILNLQDYITQLQNAFCEQLDQIINVGIEKGVSIGKPKKPRGTKAK